MNTYDTIYKKLLDLSENGRVPKMGAVSVAAGYLLDTIQGAYRYFTDTGKLLKTGNSRLYLFPKDTLPQDRDNVSHATDKNTIHIVMFIVGVACVIASIYYTAVFSKCSCLSFRRLCCHALWLSSLRCLMLSAPCSYQNSRGTFPSCL
jgi:hypothetical protein